jgi:hypothetical protein
VHYHTAMSLNPLNEAARAGLERLEKAMRGVDPDDDGSGEGSLEGAQYI